MTVLDASSAPKLPRGVRLHFDKVRNAHVLLAPERAFNIGDTAVTILKLVDGTRTVGDIAALLAAQYKADAALIERDILAMLNDLAGKRVVEA